MIKVSLRSNNRMMIATIAFIILSIALFYVRFNYIIISRLNYYVWSISLELIYLLLLIYLVSILTLFREKLSISTAVTMYLCIDTMTFITTEWPRIIPAYGIGVLTLIIYIYLLVQLFKVKNRYVALPFKLFGFSFLILALFKFLFALTFPLTAHIYEVEYSGILTLLTPLSILYVLKMVDSFIKGQNIQNTTTAV